MNSKRIVGFTVAGIICLILVTSIGGYLYLKSASFLRFAIAKIEQQAEAATGAKVEIGKLDLDFSTLTAHLFNITLHGTEAPNQSPLLHADELTVSIKIVSALKRQVSLSQLLIEHPVIHVEVSAAGRNNLPSPPPSQNSSQTSVFDLAIGHAQITNGEVNYNDRKTPLDASLYDLGVDIHFTPGEKQYAGAVSYRNGQLRYAQYTPLPHSLNVNFSATPAQLALQSAVFKVASSEVALHGIVSNYANPVADGDYRIVLHVQDFAQMSPGSKPAGNVFLQGKMHYQAQNNEPLLQTVSITGDLASDFLTAVSSGRKVELRRLHGSYQLAGGSLLVKNLKADSLGGSILASADIKHLDATPDSQVQAELHDISLRALQQMVGQAQVNAASVSGTVNGTAHANWIGNVANLKAHADLSVQAQARSRENPSATEVPVDGAIHVSYDGRNQTIEFQQTSLHIPSAAVTVEGQVSNRSNLQIQLAANDLHQLENLVASFRPDSAAPPPISGSATVNVVVRGTMKSPNIAGSANAQNLKVQGSEWKSASLQLQANPSQVSVQNGSLINARQGQATFSASVALHNWSYDPANAIKANLNAQQLRLSELQDVAGQHYPISGNLTAKLSLEGSQLNPVGSGSLQIANAIAYDEPIQNFALRFQAADGTISSTLNLAAAAGAVNANLAYTPKTKAYNVRLDAPSIVLQKLRTIQEKNAGLTGTLNASVSGQGTLDNPQLTAIVQMPQLQVRQNSIAGLKAQIQVANHAADLDLDSNVSKASIRGRGHIALTGDYYTEAAIDSGTIPLEALMETYANGAPQGFTGQTEFHATLKGPLKQKSQMEAHVTIPVLRASYQSLDIGIANPIRADYSNSVVTLQPSEFRGTGTSLKIQGQVPIAGNAAPTLTANGSVDVRILKILSPDLQSSGLVTLNIRASGTPQEPVVQGQIQLKDVAMTTTDAPVGVEQLDGTLNLTNDHLQISSMTGQIGGGHVAVSGSIAYKPSLQFNVSLQGKGVRLRYPQGLRSQLDANLAFSGSTQASSLNGRVLIDSLSFTPDFDLSKFGDQFSTGVSTPSQPGFADNVRLAIGVQSQEQLSATSTQVSISGRVAVQVGGTAANPVITGRTNLTAGELFYNNDRYQLQNGVITFDDPNETHPVLNVSVTTTVEQYNLTLSLRGPLDKLTTSYVSDPPLATADIINLIARGQTTQESAASSQSTDSMVASQAASQLSNGVQKLAGISSLQIDPTIGGNNQDPSARVAIQQRVTKNLFFTFSTDVSQPGSEIVQGEYQLNKRWSVSMARDQLGGFSVDGKYRKQF